MLDTETTGIRSQPPSRPDYAPGTPRVDKKLADEGCDKRRGVSRQHVMCAADLSHIPRIDQLLAPNTNGVALDVEAEPFERLYFPANERRAGHRIGVHQISDPHTGISFKTVTWFPPERTASMTPRTSNENSIGIISLSRFLELSSPSTCCSCGPYLEAP